MGFQLLNYVVLNKAALHRHSEKYKQFRESKYVQHCSHKEFKRPVLDYLDVYMQTET